MPAVLLGRTSAGAIGDFVTGGNTACWPFTAAASGVLGLIWMETLLANATGTVKLGIYDDNGAGTDPADLLAVATVLSGGNGSAPFSADVSGFSVNIVSGTIYWLGVRNSSEGHDFRGDAGGFYRENAGVDFPLTWPAGAGTNSVDARIWGEEYVPLAPLGLTSWDYTLHPKILLPSDSRLSL